MKTKSIPIGHPISIFLPDSWDEKYFGIAKITIVAPKRLLFGVLPAISKEGKLVFPLCDKCQNTQSRLCNHDDRERSITGDKFNLLKLIFIYAFNVK